MQTVQEYLDKNASPDQLDIYKKISAQVKKLVPEVEESVSYGVIAFKFKGKYVIYFAVYPNHLSVYPTMGAVEATKGTKATYQFKKYDAVAKDAVKKIVAVQLKKFQ